MDAEKDTVIHRHVLRSTATNYVAKLINLGTWFLLTPFILHHLGPTEYGLWIVVGSSVAYGTLLNLGISGAVIKYIAEYRARGENLQAQGLIATALCLYTGLGLVAGGLGIAIAPAFPDLFNVPPEDRATATRLVSLMGMGLGITIPCATTTAVLWGLQRFDLSNLINVIGTILSAAATVAVLLLGGGVLGMVAASIAITLIMQAPTVWLIYRIAPELRFGWRGAKISLVSTVMSFSWPFFVMDVADRLQTKTDEIVIGAFLPISTVTPYAIARKLSEVPHLLTDQFLRVLVPLASELHAENDHVRLRTMYITGTRLSLAIFLPVGCALIVLARPILTVWVGSDYADYTHLVIILTVASLLDTSQWPAGSILQGMGRHRPLAFIAVVTGIANLALSIALVGSLGLTGVALGTLVPGAVACFGLILPYAMRVIGVTKTQLIKEVLLPAFVPGFPTIIVLYVLQQAIEPSSLLSIMSVGAIGAFVYLTAYLNMGSSKIERQTYRNLVSGKIRMAESYFKRK